MKSALVRRMLFCTLAVIAGITLADLRIPELRQWTSVSGSNITARFVEISGANVVLEQEDGKRISIGLARLSLKDRIWMQEWMQPCESDSSAEAGGGPLEAGNPEVDLPGGSDELSVFAEGKWEGCHAVYEQSEFDAVIDEKAVLQLYMKKNGVRVEQEPFTVQLSCKRDNEASSYGDCLDVSEFASPGTPVIQPRELKFAGKLEEDVSFELFYTFQKDRVEIWGRAVDSGKKGNSTRFRLQFKIARAFDIPDQMPMPEQQKLMEGNKFTMRATDGEKITCDYIRREKLKRYAKDVVITGPVYAGRKITVEAGDYKNAPLSVYVSNTGAPWEGWSISMTKEDASADKSKQKLIITVK